MVRSDFAPASGHVSHTRIMAVVLAALCDSEAEYRAVRERLARRPDVRLLQGGLMPGGHKWWQRWVEPEPEPERA